MFLHTPKVYTCRSSVCRIGDWALASTKAGQFSCCHLCQHDSFAACIVLRWNSQVARNLGNNFNNCNYTARGSQIWPDMLWFNQADCIVSEYVVNYADIRPHTEIPSQAAIAVIQWTFLQRKWSWRFTKPDGYAINNLKIISLLISNYRILFESHIPGFWGCLPANVVPLLHSLSVRHYLLSHLRSCAEQDMAGCWFLSGWRGTLLLRKHSFHPFFTSPAHVRSDPIFSPSFWRMEEI